MAMRFLLTRCAFRREMLPVENLVLVEAAGRSANICENCLAILIVHHRYHNLKMEKLIVQISTELNGS